jgi:hypothetical protein
MPVIVLVIVDILQMTLMGRLLPFTLLAFPPSFHCATFGEEGGVRDTLAR